MKKFVSNMVILQKYAFATFTSTAMFFICAICLACTKKDGFSATATVDTVVNVSPITPIPGSPKTMLALGDSYTIGQSVTEGERFPNQTLNLLKNQLNIAYPATIVATTGWTTRNLLDGIASANLTGTYDVVTLLIGVNNQYQRIDATVYKNEFPLLLQKAIDFARGNKSHVFVVSIPDYGVTPFGGNNPAISIEVAHYNAMCKTMTEQLGVAFTDITPISQKAAIDQSLTASDGLHPSGKQYGLWAGLLAPKVLEVLK